MRVREIGKLFVGSCGVYLVVAACSAYSADPTPGATGSSGGSTGSSGSSGTSPVDPVPNALADGYRSGSRLKLRFYEGSDGSKQWIGFFDTELQTNCYVSDATIDKKPRCMPPQEGMAFFSDAGCAHLAGFAVPKSVQPPPRFAGIPRRAYLDHFELGALATPPAGLFVGDKTGIGGENECHAANVPAEYGYYVAGAPVAPSRFVEMTIKTE